MSRLRNIAVRLYCKMFDADCNDEQLRKRIYTYYWIKTGKKICLKSPQTYTEKVQEYKLQLKGKNYERYTDKIAVRDFIAKTVGKRYLIPILGVWDCADSIPFAELPDSYVLKTNHGAGMNYIVSNNSQINTRQIQNMVSKWLSTNYTEKNGYEFQYENIKPKVYAEKKISDSDGNLQEYKFFCFSGEPVYCMVDLDRFGIHKRNIYDLNWNLQEWNIGNFPNEKKVVSKPNNFDEMVYVSKRLAQNFSHVRVDLYNVDGFIYFSELTFTTGSGFSFPRPETANKMLGELWQMEVK